MTWRFTYVPILSASSLELLEAPGTFMMGCHSKHLDVVEQVEGLVVVNIDEGTVTINPSDSSKGLTAPAFTLSTMTSVSTAASERSEFLLVDASSRKIPSLPEEPAKLFKNICKRAKFQMELSDVQRPFYYDIEEERAFRMKKCLQFNTEISFAFLEMMVNLFRGTLSYLRTDLRRFNKQQFLDNVATVNKSFYERVLNTDMFKQFLEDRLNEKLDYWTDHEIRTRPYAKRASQEVDASPGLSHRQQMKPMRKQVSVTTFSSLSPRVFEILRLPALNDTATYVRHTLAMLNKTIEECRNPHLRPSYIYMRGMFLAAEGNIKAALDDLLSLHGHNVRLLPIGLIQKLLQLLAESEREEMLRVSGRHVAELLVLAEQDIDKGNHRHYRSIMDNRVALPDTDLSLEDFVETVSLLEMSTDYDTIQRLFLALAQPQRPTHVEKYTFEVLQLSYEDNQNQCESLALPGDCLQMNEIILRVSNLIKTDFGMGRIVLTDKRLFFIKDVSNRYKEVVKLRNITSLEKIQTHWYLIAVDVLVINDTANKVKFTAWLKEERNSWAILIEEMRAGKVVAEATRDFTAIGQAVQNVLLVDAVIRRDSVITCCSSFVALSPANKVKFTAWLKEERNSWAILIEEMRAGKVVAEATRDFTAIGQAVQNVLLVDAVIRSGQDERATHHKHVTRAAETLCYFSAYMAEGRHNLPPDTLQALQHRVDPNMGQRERKTVEVLLYTAGGHGSETTNSPPRLWCGMGDGKVRVFDATNWVLEESFVQTKATVSALVAVGQGQVWAGSHGIFIIDVDTISCNKTLTEHADLVADICLTNMGRYAYSASVDGLIVMWEVQTLRVLRRIRLTGRRSLRRIMVHADRIWCGTWQSIIVLDDEGSQLQTFSFCDPDTNKQLDLDCFHIFNQEIWAGCRRQGLLIVWDLDSTQLKQILKLDCRGISQILLFGGKVWVGTKEGTIYIYNSTTKALWKTIRAHEDAIRSLCSAESRYIMSGAGSKDGKVAIWSPNIEAGDVECVTAL
ncbi:DENN domain-containing protein 3 [Plakobranchus ocellatus]|uniref:DENN domain-containing protein 3 n=1 Tax=Plakobranchus ocellatus TaxID=259542 RepID=A0AAV3YYJ2_9GAST|nr:DENN domain-containing protein 3 [Plakobranchus ocellatus]